MNNPFYRLTRFRIFRILLPSLLAAWIGWNDFRPLYSKEGALFAVFLVFVLMASMVYASDRFSGKVSANFVKTLTSTEEGLSSMKSMAITAAATLFVYTLGIWSVARSFGLLK
uniref:Uncharacterized protein n=1 Tax=mine drainage metagenome TaxID=410659 RepID=E6QIG5_9ZZZZ